MGIGAVVRKLFGRHEHAVAELYRSLFVDLDAYADQIAAWVPNPRRILEVGCGEGAVTERLVRCFPEAEILAIDITPNAGRLFRGSRDRVTFAEMPVQAVAATRPGAFDVAIISDVIHHVPVDLRTEILATTAATLREDGALVVKDWARTASPIHWIVHGSDRWLTGDRVHYLRQPQIDRLIEQALGGRPILASTRIGPWRNNYALLARPAAA